MSKLIRLAVIFLTLTCSVSALPQGDAERSGGGGGNGGSCRRRQVRKPWQRLTRREQTQYIDATLCLFRTPARHGFPGALTRWDELQYAHVIQPNFIHDEGQFLPWHRYYLALHANMLRDDCGYNGPLPYWNETADVGRLAQSALLQPNAFGGDGVVGSGPRRCIQDGPFVNSVLNLRRLGQPAEPTCIYRQLNQTLFGMAQQSNIDACMAINDYTTAWECWFLNPHAAGHAGLGGVMSDAVLSPGDPLFFLHHGWIDALWWRWQSVDLRRRLTDMGGRNTLSEAYMLRHNLTFPGPEFTEHDGDPGNVTTLNHVLWMGGVARNITVRDVMDVRANVFCGEYEY